MNRKREQAGAVPDVHLPDILDVEQAARFLGISKLSMYKLIRGRKNKVPVKRVAGAFKISKRQLLDWFESL
ncbi:MAG: helix-turn-helix domain-containing protein [Chitinivibrionales bacterium]|nr:helix-turn-helix domain-containing protein [Chitinivibrionales bacterium]MBD3395881.1 helix-turn-helix domain-containing protein [Chitinivibrionales bacterium]